MFRKKKKAEILFAVFLKQQNWDIGEVIDGHILFRKDIPTKFAGIKARFHGEETIFLAPGGEQTKVKSVFNTGLIEVSPKGKAIEGDTIVPFKFTIPETLPPSFDSTGHGHVKYYIEAKLLFKGHEEDLVSNLTVFIHSRVPAELPSTFSEKKEWGLLTKESIHFSCALDKGLYIQNEVLGYNMSFENKTKKKIIRVTSSINFSLKYGKNLLEEITCQKDLPDDVIPILGGTQFTNDYFLVLPETLRSSTKSHYITSTYNLSFKFEFESGSHHPVVFQFPILIKGDLGTEISKEPRRASIADTTFAVQSEEGTEDEITKNKRTFSVTDTTPSLTKVPTSPEFDLPLFIPNPDEEVDFSTMSSSVCMARVHPTPEQLPLPYGHPAYYSTAAHYSPPSFVVVEEANEVELNATTEQLLSL